jgi:hypothetical protein
MRVYPPKPRSFSNFVRNFQGDFSATADFYETPSSLLSTGGRASKCKLFLIPPGSEGHGGCSPQGANLDRGIKPDLWSGKPKTGGSNQTEWKSPGSSSLPWLAFSSLDRFRHHRAQLGIRKLHARCRKRGSKPFRWAGLPFGHQPSI